MITTITLNAAIDQVYELDCLAVGNTNRVVNKRQQGGGKGVNVARVITALGGHACVSGFVGGLNGEKIEMLLKEEKLHAEFVHIAQESRICLTVINKQTGEMTELLEQGPIVQAKEWQQMLTWIEQQAEQSDYFVLSGSLPKGLPAKTYATIIERLKKKGIRVVLDTSAEALFEGVQAIPYAIKPNEEELAQLLGKVIESEQDLIQAGERLRALGIEHICFSLGAKGALFINEFGVFRVDAPKIEVVNTVGSGDSFLGGLTYKLAQGATYSEAYKWAVACGSANASEKDIAKVHLHVVEDFVQKLKITKIK
ncbi:1-phosphofructokinase [Metasolibacillus meyeri]|uniref:1-phosphofructokinase n=1 Tax=Metasolibacillus meyeri TaxID=1071052 RepID=UPI000D2F7FF9|nr:1-phosphofructokinase [Metasolibacillus meyeri]